MRKRKIEEDVKDEGGIDSIRGSLIVDVDGDGKAFGGGAGVGVEPGERSLLVGENKGGVLVRGRGSEEQREQEADQDGDGKSEMRVGHGCLPACLPACTREGGRRRV